MLLVLLLIQLALALVHTSNQSIIFRLRPDAKSRINAIYMTTYFIGGAAGSALGFCMESWWMDHDLPSRCGTRCILYFI